MISQRPAGAGLREMRRVARRRIVLLTFDAEDGLRRLASDLDSGVWHQRNADLLDREALDVGYRLLRWDMNTRTS